MATGIGPTIGELRDRAAVDGAWTYRHSIRTGPAVERNDYLVDLVTQKRVIHVGCAAAGEARRQIERGRHLFAEIERTCAAQLGVDPDGRGLDLLDELVGPALPPLRGGLSDIPRESLVTFSPDYVLLPEVVEHVANPGLLLEEAKEVAAQTGAEVVLTVPNALAWPAIEGWARELVDVVHPDHICTFTPRTLQTLVEKSGLIATTIRPYYWGAVPGPPSVRAQLIGFARSGGGLNERMWRVVAMRQVPRFADGWICHAR